MRFVYKISCAIFLCIHASSAMAQIWSNTANARINSAYQIAGKQDPIFIFDKENPDKRIYAASPGYDSAVFEWAYYRPSTNDYLTFATYTGYKSALNTLATSRGYRVIITGSTRTDTFRCWAIIDDYRVKITSTVNDTIQTGNIYCGYIDEIDAQLDTNSLVYYKPYPLNGSIVRLKNTYTITWTSNHPNDAENPDNTIYGNPLSAKVTRPYWEDTWYIIEVRDDFGEVRRDSAFYRSIQPHASFLLPQYIKLADSAYYPHRDTLYYKDIYDSAKYTKTSAPAKFLFRNKSENANSYTWFFGDSLSENKINKDSVPYTYQLPGDYYVKLVARKNVSFRFDPCIDTFPKAGDEIGKLTIDPPEIDNKSKQAPNVFTPGEQNNFYWRLYDDVSITDIEIAIYNRYGKRVHYFKGNIRYWEGWDGYYKGNIVPTGVYYYVVKKINLLPTFGSSKDPGTITKDETRNFIHVFNKPK